MKNLTETLPASYQIVVRGGLDESWSSYLSGMKITVAVNADNIAVTTLMGDLLDQAALLCVLNQVYDLGLPLILVQWLAERQNDA